MMRLTTKSRYAVAAMLDIAIHMDGNPVSLADIAERQGISITYLEQLFAKLRRAGLVRSVRGPGGGYLLNRNNANVTVAQIITAVDEQVDATGCGGQSNCQQGQVCLTHQLWSDLNDQVHGFLNGVSLADLMARNNIRRIAKRQRQQANTIAAQMI
jgi:Rrf2 family iron-sulfur cluster assembly transcriptional regulator